MSEEKKLLDPAPITVPLTRLKGTLAVLERQEEEQKANYFKIVGAKEVVGKMILAAENEAKVNALNDAQAGEEATAKPPADTKTETPLEGPPAPE